MQQPSISKGRTRHAAASHADGCFNQWSLSVTIKYWLQLGPERMLLWLLQQNEQ
jgi:hypothetical protein